MSFPNSLWRMVGVRDWEPNLGSAERKPVSTRTAYWRGSVRECCITMKGFVSPQDKKQRIINPNSHGVVVLTCVAAFQVDPGFWWPNTEEKKYSWNIFLSFLIKNYDFLIPGPPERTSKLQEKPSDLKRDHPALHKNEIDQLFSLLYVIFGSGSGTLVFTRTKYELNARQFKKADF